MPRPQFSLKTLLWLTVVVAAFCAGTQLDRYLKERADPRDISTRSALDENTELDFAEQPLSDVIDYLKQRHDVEIQINNKALIDAGVGTDTPITRVIKGITLRSALKMILDELDLTYVVQNGTLMITSKNEAQGDLYSLKTLMWLAVVVTVLLGAVLFGRAWGRRLEARSDS